MKTAHSHHVAVLARQAPTRRQIVRALHSAGLELRFIERAADLDSIQSPHLLLLDTDSTSAADVTGCLERAGRGGVPVVMLSLGSDKLALLQLMRSYGISHLVAKHGAVRAVYPLIDERELQVTCQKVLRGDVFGLEKYIGGWGVKLHPFRVASMTEKARLLEAFEGYLTDLECPPAVVPDVLTVADELIVNALLHAPRDEGGKLTYEHLGPVPELAVAPEDAVDVTWGCDGQRLMLSVADRFGALERERITHYLAKGFAPRRHAVEEKVGGAGLGLAMSLKRLHQLVFNVQPRVRTEVLAGWYLRVDTASDFRQVSKSINLFWQPESQAPASTGAEGGETLTHFALPPLSVGEPSLSVKDADLPRLSTPTSVAATGAESAAELSTRVLKRITGRINERFDLPLPEAGALRLDLSGITGFTSAGIIRWLQWVAVLPARDVELAACPEVVVRSACEVEGFLGRATVRSVMAPFECPSCFEAFTFELPVHELDVDSPRPCSGCGSTLRFAGLLHEYLAFRELVQGEKDGFSA